VRILLINHYAGSISMGMEYRPFYLGREWVADGHAVTIVGADFSHLRGRQPVVDADLDSTEEEGVKFRWLRTNRYTGNGVARITNMLAFVGKLLAYAPRISCEERADLVICSSTYPMDIYPGALIARKTNAPLLFEVHDLWPLTPMLLGGYSPRHPYIALLQRAEDWAYQKADMVVSILPSARDHMVRRGLDPRKFIHIPNGVAASRDDHVGHLDLPPPVASRLARERERGRFLIGFAGGLNQNMALETLLQAAQILAGSEAAFLIAGDGRRWAELQAEAARLRLDNFHLLGRIPKASVPAFLSKMDALAIPWHRSPLYEFGVSPNKIFDYMLAARPILQACDASNDLVAEANCGVTVAPEDAAAFAEAILRLRELPEAERRRLGENGRRYVREYHDYRLLARRFLEAVRHASSSPVDDEYPR
jgi:glycosyltransferase involved in cell wall biosynthesis